MKIACERLRREGKDFPETPNSIGEAAGASTAPLGEIGGLAGGLRAHARKSLSQTKRLELSGRIKPRG